MAFYNAGKIIKTLRKQKNLTQDQLAEGIIEKYTLSRIENGIQSPSKKHLDALMQRLGFSSDSYPSDWVNETDYHVLSLKKSIVSSIITEDFDKTKSVIHELEKHSIDDHIDKQFLFKAKAIVDYKNDSTERKQLILNALKLTIPKFNEDLIDTYFLTNEEVSLVNQLALSYIHQDQNEKAVSILSKLKTSIDQGIAESVETSRKYTMIVYNLSKLLGLMGKYEESIAISEIGIDYCLTYNKIQYLSLLIFNKACCKNELGNKIESQNLMIQAYYGCIMCKEYSSLDAIKEYARNNLNMELSI